MVPYGADIQLFTPSPIPQAGDRFNVIFVGQLSQRKGISYLLRAYERFRGSDTHLTLVGHEQDNGAALRPWRHLYDHIPHIPRARLAEVMRQSDVFVFPTLVEGMGLVVLEAMATGLPVITTANGPGDLVRDGVDGFIVPPRDVDALVERLEELRSSPELRAEMGSNARSRALGFTWQAYRETALQHLRRWLREARVSGEATTTTTIPS